MKIKSLFESKFIKVFDLQYGEGRHYYNATRRDEEDLVAAKSTDEFKKILPDAVSCVVIWNPSGADSKADNSTDMQMTDIKQDSSKPRLLMNREFRYPTGQYLLSVPAGLIDREDVETISGYKAQIDMDNNNADSNAWTIEKNNSILIKTAMRELYEETGIVITEADEVSVINPCLFSTPGMTDESNALVKIVLNRDSLNGMSQEGAVGGELFDGFDLLTKAQAKKILEDGVDEHGIYYSVYTWAALTYFVADLWR